MSGFESVFVEHREFIFKYLMKFTKDPALAEELTQETFFRGYMNYAALKNKEKVAVWLCRIAKNAYFAWYNGQKKQAPLDTVEEWAGEESFEERFIQKESSRLALARVHGLEDPYKEVFLLSVLGGFSFKDISSVFGKSESWARVTFYRAKQKIVEQMRDC